MIAGGSRPEVYSPRHNTITPLPQPVMERLSFRTATVVSDSTVLVAGGYDDAILPTAEAYLVSIPDPET